MMINDIRKQGAEDNNPSTNSNSQYGIVLISHKNNSETAFEYGLNTLLKILNLLQVYGRVQDVSGHRTRTK